MGFRDQLLRCGACGKEFVYTVSEQRRRKQQGLSTSPPAFCSECRGADVRLAEASGPAAPEAAADNGDAGSSRGRGDRKVPRPSQRGRPRRQGRAQGGRDGGRRGRGNAGRRGHGRPGRGGGTRTRRREKQTALRVRHVGAVKYFNTDKGYGFIASEDEGEVFVHLSSLLDQSVRELEVGSPVEFEIEHTPRGPQAVDVIQLA